MLMCTQLSTLEKLIKNIDNKIIYLANKNPVSRSNLDLLLRKYASKALTIRVRRQNKPFVQRVKSQPSSKVTFTPPNVPPSKQNWTPDDEVCMSLLN